MKIMRDQNSDDQNNSFDEDDSFDDDGDNSEIMDFVPPGIIRIECYPENKARFVHVDSC